jgi:hypothetical protein
MMEKGCLKCTAPPFACPSPPRTYFQCSRVFHGLDDALLPELRGGISMFGLRCDFKMKGGIFDDRCSLRPADFVFIWRCARLR